MRFRIVGHGLHTGMTSPGYELRSLAETPWEKRYEIHKWFEVTVTYYTRRIYPKLGVHVSGSICTASSTGAMEPISMNHLFSPWNRDAPIVAISARGI